MRGQSDSSLRQVEAEFMSHWPAQPRIDARCRRPHAFDQSANYSSVGLREPRLQWSIDFQLNVARLWPSHHPIGKRGLKYFGVVTQSDQQAAVGFAEKIVEGGRQRAPVLAIEGQRHAMVIARQLHQRAAMSFRKLDEIVGFKADNILERR